VFYGLILFFVKNHNSTFKTTSLAKQWNKIGPWLHHILAVFNYFAVPGITFALMPLRGINSAVEPVVYFYGLIGVANLVIYFKDVLPHLENGRKMARIRQLALE
jgi:hypothetical protein